MPNLVLPPSIKPPLQCSELSHTDTQTHTHTHCWQSRIREATLDRCAAASLAAVASAPTTWLRRAAGVASLSDCLTERNNIENSVSSDAGDEFDHKNLFML